MQEIGEQCFLNCKSIETVIIPHTLTKIYSDAFDGCTALTDIYYDGTEAEWKALTDMTVSATIHFRARLTGDVNGDGTVNNIDAAMVYACHNGRLTLTAYQYTAADVNGDGMVNNIDAAMIYAYHNGRLANFPV